MTSNIKNISIALFFLAATVGVILGIHNGRILAHSTEEAAGNVKDMSAEAKEWFHAEHDRASSPKNQAALEAAVQVGAVFNASGRLLNTQTIPRANKVLDALTAEAQSLKTATDTGARQLDANGTASRGLLIAATETVGALGVVAQKLGVDMGTLTAGINQFIAQSGSTVEAVTKKVNDERFNKILDNALRFTDEGASTAGNVEAASEQLPAIAEALNKIAQTTSRFSKAYWVARILSIVVPLVP